MSILITLTTDFGDSDAYAAILKGVILKINPSARIIDISHRIEPQNIGQAAYIIETAAPYFPEGTIHLIVVDPGLGSSRKAIILKSAKGIFVAPDNGVLSYVMGDEFQAVEISEPRFCLSPVNATFHGRDIFAPVAAHLSLGTPMAEFGGKINSPVRLPLACPKKDKQGAIIGHIIHIDRFGNLITNIKQSDLPQRPVEIEVAGYIINGLSPSYAEGPEILAIIESNDRLEIAARNGNAADILKTKVGDQVIVRDQKVPK